MKTLLEVEHLVTVDPVPDRNLRSDRIVFAKQELIFPAELGRSDINDWLREAVALAIWDNQDTSRVSLPAHFTYAQAFILAAPYWYAVAKLRDPSSPRRHAKCGGELVEQETLPGVSAPPHFLCLRCGAVIYT